MSEENQRAGRLPTPQEAKQAGRLPTPRTEQAGWQPTPQRAGKLPAPQEAGHRDAARAANREGLIEVAPGVYSGAVADVDRTVLARFAPGDRAGRYVLRALQCRYAVLDRALLATLGLPGRYNLIHRLAAQGYVRLIAISQRTYMLDLDSYVAHLQAVQDAADQGEDFWTEGKRARLNAE